MSSGSNPLRKESTLSAFTYGTYLFDRIFVIVHFLVVAMLPLGLNVLIALCGSSTYDPTFHSAADFAVSFAFPVLVYLPLFALWFYIWEGKRWAFVVYSILTIYLIALRMMDRHRVPWLELSSLIYLALRLSDSMGPRMDRASDEA